MRWSPGFSWVVTLALVGGCGGRSSETGGAGNESGTGGTAGVSGGGNEGGTGGTSGTPGGGGVAPGCAPQRASGQGDCELAFGPYFLGAGCGYLSGCSCVGEDCDQAYENVEACESAHRGCIRGCAPEDAQFIGLCDPASQFVFTGVECIGMSGCSCVGSECGNLVPLPPVDPGTPTPNPCGVAYDNCFGAPRSCDQIAEVYAEYTSRNACDEDSECRVTGGHCGVGLGGCYHLMNYRWPESGLDALAAEWQRLGCSGGICDCPATPESALCIDGVCTAAP